MNKISAVLASLSDLRACRTGASRAPSAGRERRRVTYRSMHIRHVMAAGLAIAGTWATGSMAAPLFAQGQIDHVRTHDSIALPQWTPPMFWFSLKNVTNLGTCGTYYGRVLFVAKDPEAYRMVLSAQASGHEIAAHVDDTIISNGYCAVKYITIGNPITIP